MQSFEAQVEEYVRRRCREHLKLQETLLNRPLAFDYRLEHTRTAVGIAGNLAVELGIDPGLARIAVWLHDIAKCWDPSLTEAENRQRGKNHGPEGGKEAEDFLRSIGFPEDLASQVKQAISVHAGLIKDYSLKEPLSALVWDADKLSKISGAGMLHYLGYILASDDEIIDLAAYFAADDWIDLHRGIRDSLNTETARRRADLEMAAAVRLRLQLLAAVRGDEP
jgi:putative nucleotidyltransferase with HDIG domain